MMLSNLLGTKIVPDLAQAEAEFHQAYPTYEHTSFLDALRAVEYARLGEHTYLDYTGGSLYAERQIREHMYMLRTNVFGNPHSINPSSQRVSKLIERTRASVLEYFRANPKEYLVIFTPNASGALKLVGEAYPFEAGGQYALFFDNHNSVNGIREYARAKGANIAYLPLVTPNLCADPASLKRCLAGAQPKSHNLLAFPAQSNFTGQQHPLELIHMAKAYGWDVLLDAAAFVPTNRLDLSQWHPDFVSISFYKMFGYPTGIGCLLARREALDKLGRPWFAGGTISLASAAGDWHQLAENEEGFEDGTLNYLGLPAVEIGLRHMQSIGIEMIHERVCCLTGWLLEQLTGLCHSNGTPLVRIYGPQSNAMRGGTIAFNVLDPSGKVVDERIVDIQAAEHDFSLRTGCFCNPGAGEAAFGRDQQALVALKNCQSLTCDEYIKHLGLESVGAHRVSLGIVSNFADVYRFIVFLQQTFTDVFPDTQETPPRLHC